MTDLEKLLAEVTPKPAREYLAEQYEYLNRYTSYADLARHGDGEFTMCSIRAIERAQEDLARKVIAAEKLVEVLNEALIKQENDRTLWVAEWQMWSVDTLAALAAWEAAQ